VAPFTTSYSPHMRNSRQSETVVMGPLDVDILRDRGQLDGTAGVAAARLALPAHGSPEEPAVTLRSDG
jgi:hypothetical protein